MLSRMRLGKNVKCVGKCDSCKNFFHPQCCGYGVDKFERSPAKCAFYKFCSDCLAIDGRTCEQVLQQWAQYKFLKEMFEKGSSVYTWQHIDANGMCLFQSVWAGLPGNVRV